MSNRLSGATHRILPAIVCLATLVLAASPQESAQKNPCEENPAYRKLDFWLGHWEVTTPDGRRAGSNHIHKILRGCAVQENWKAAGGREGKSLFYYVPATRQWKQVWVTDSGSMKEKQLVKELDNGAVRFQGQLPLPNGGTYLDRTTLMPLEGGRVRQVIEISRDGGRTWRTTFDATYTRKP